MVGTRNYAITEKRENTWDSKIRLKQQRKERNALAMQQRRVRASKIEEFILGKGECGVSFSEVALEFGFAVGSILQFISNNCFCVYEENQRLYHTFFDIGVF